LLIGFSIASLIYNAWPTLETGIVFSFTQEGVIVTSILIAGIPCLLLLVIGVMLIIGSFINFSIPRRKKFVVPSDMAKSWFWYERIRFHPYEEGEEPEKNLTKKKQ
jgi:hypothetical protein